MPLRESLPVKVTLTVEVDGHRLTFEGTGEVSGSRWHGKNPREHNYAGLPKDTLEAQVRGTVDTCAARVQARAEQLVARMYPVADDPEGDDGD